MISRGLLRWKLEMHKTLEDRLLGESKTYTRLMSHNTASIV